jgi:Tfp pilus assembly protein PilO
MNPIIPKKNVPYAIMAGLIALMALSAWIGVVPMRQAISGKMDDLQKFYTIRENRERQVARLPELEAQYQEIVAGEDTMRILLDEEHIVDFVKTLEGLASDSGVEISIEAKESSAIVEKKAVKPAAVNKQPAVDDNDAADASKKTKPSIMDGLPYDRYLHISVSVRGEYAGIMDFLHRMETLPFALDVVGMDVHLNTDTKEQDAAVPEAGRNPFMIVPSGNTQVSQPEDTAAPSEKQLPLEADFDTVVYIRK